MSHPPPVQAALLPPEDRLLWWMKERHLIYLRRKAGKPKPWTQCPIMQSYFFTNPYRENDKVTAWFREHVRDPLRDDPRVLFATICFRWFNWIPTGAWLMTMSKRFANPFGLLTEWDLRAAVNGLTTYKDVGNQVFTGAFNISNSGSTKPKINRVCEDYIQPAWEACAPGEWMCEELKAGAYSGKMGMQDAHELLMELPGMRGSGFMSYEVVCDLRYTRFLEHAPDKLTWCNPGPGARRGLNRVLEQPVDAKISAETWQEETRRLLARARRELIGMPPCEMREIEMSLCELDKYDRILEGGRGKRRYPGI